MEKWLNRYAKCIDPDQPAQSAQADQGRNISPFVNFLRVNGSVFPMIQFVDIRQTGFYRSLFFFGALLVSMHHANLLFGRGSLIYHITTLMGPFLCGALFGSMQHANLLSDRGSLIYHITTLAFMGLFICGALLGSMHNANFLFGRGSLIYHITTTYEIRFRDVTGQSTVHMYSYAIFPKHG